MGFSGQQTAFTSRRGGDYNSSLRGRRGYPTAGQIPANSLQSNGHTLQVDGFGLGVNPEKTELFLFTRKYKVPNLILPKLHQARLALSNQAKYLGVILEKRLL